MQCNDDNAKPHDLKMGTSPRGSMDSRRRRRGTRHAHSTLPDDDERLWNYARLVPLHSTPRGIKNALRSQDLDFRLKSLFSHSQFAPLFISVD